MNFIDTVSIAKREAKGDATSEEIAWLHQPEHLSMWVQALKAAIADAVDQFDLQRERIERARNEATAGLITQERYHEVAEFYETWSKKANRYRLGLEQRLAEITAAHDSEVERLRRAIEQHRAAQMGYSPNEVDFQLWAVLDE